MGYHLPQRYLGALLTAVGAHHAACCEAERRAHHGAERASSSPSVADTVGEGAGEGGGGGGGGEECDARGHGRGGSEQSALEGAVQGTDGEAAALEAELNLPPPPPISSEMWSTRLAHISGGPGDAK